MIVDFKAELKYEKLAREYEEKIKYILDNNSPYIARLKLTQMCLAVRMDCLTDTIEQLKASRKDNE